MHSFSVNMAMLQYFINIQGSYFNFWVLLNEGGRGYFGLQNLSPKMAVSFFSKMKKNRIGGGDVAYSGLKESWNWSC